MVDECSPIRHTYWYLWSDNWRVYSECRHEGPDYQNIRTYAEKVCQINRAIIANEGEITQYFKARMTPTDKQDVYETRIDRPDLYVKVEKWLSFWNNTWREVQRIRPPSMLEETHNDLLELVNLGREVLLGVRLALQESLEDLSDNTKEERAMGAIKKFQIDAFQGRLVDVLRKTTDISKKMNAILRTLN